MGANASTSSEASGSKPAQVTPIPEDEVPYQGPQIQYCLVNIEAQLSTKVQFLSTTNMITTNVDQYYQEISQPYSDGFVMQQFQKIPGVQRQSGFTSVSVPYQAALIKPVNVSTNERWKLRVEKSFLKTQAFVNWGTTQTTASNTTDIQQKVVDVAMQCGRLICIEVTGFQQNQNQLFMGVSGISGVDLFFNMPLHSNPTRYVYQAINVPITFKMKQSFPSPLIQLQTDIVGTFSTFLQQGWKLVEINFDMSLMTSQTGFTSAQGSQNSIWFFEKEASRINDNTPVWQGCVIDYMHKVSTTFGGSRAKAGWDDVLGQMGQRGWELATLLETPESHMSGLSSVTQKIKMFFQRRIIAQPSMGFASGLAGPVGTECPPHGLGGFDTLSGPPPPSYEEVVKPSTGSTSGPSAPSLEKSEPPPAGFNLS